MTGSGPCSQPGFERSLWALVYVVLLPALAAGCGPYAREATFVVECPSPDGALKATFWMEVSGLIAVGFVDFRVSLSRADDAFDRVSAIDGPLPTVLHLKRGGDVWMQWRGNNELRVAYPSTASVVERPASVEFGGRAVGIVTKEVPALPEGLLEGGSKCLDELSTEVDGALR